MTNGKRLDAALRLDESSHLIAARSWVGIFAEGMREPALFKQIRRVLETEILAIQRASGDSLDTEGASAVLAYIVGALVFGAYAPKKTAVFAAPQLHLMLTALTDTSESKPLGPL